MSLSTMLEAIEVLEISDKERKAYTKANVKWVSEDEKENTINKYMRVRTRAADPESWLKMVVVEMQREEGPRSTILQRLIAKVRNVQKDQDIDEIFNDLGLAKPKKLGRPAGSAKKPNGASASPAGV